MFKIIIKLGILKVMQLQACEESFTPTKPLQSKWQITHFLITLHFQTAINNVFYNQVKEGFVALQVLSVQKYQISQLLTQDKASWLEFRIITSHKQGQKILRFLFPTSLLNSQWFCVVLLVWVFFCGWLVGGFGDVCVCAHVVLSLFLFFPSG